MHHDHSEDLACIFCGHTGLFICDRLICQAYISDRKCKKNAAGKVVLPNGQFVPRNIPGHFIKDRIDELVNRTPDIPVSPSLMYDIAPSTISASSLHGISLTSNSSNNLEARISALEQELFAL